MRNEALRWIQLSNPDSPDFATRLLALLASLQPKFVAARLRTNSIVSGGSGTWFMTQWNFGPGDSGLQTSVLTDQIQYSCLADLTDPCKNVKAVWDNFPADPYPPPLPESYPFDYSQNFPGILSPSQSNPVGAAGAGTLSIPNGLAHPTTAARDVLAMQQCFFCHGGETSAVFTHLLNHDGSLAQDTSCFIAGKNGVARPTFKQLLQLDSSATCPVTVQFMAPRGIGCKSDAVTPSCSAGLLTETRNFQELARRAMHMSMLLLENHGRFPLRVFQRFQTKSLANYGAQMVH
jgi:hypothetical protein